eukprot:CAMPEP_0119549638 /NCGR_PEP_ID=MMETSP1352-20130426/3292_1 /TAXON_ID=265584 /ORGANISM="Stauroneis constricta, Strain CCMP1120" /LENGTH=121 /DNA_ID=CAMNT_0007595235 /DNA_START=290 /DNA_END=655 /DNA_ORIENTATION=-
MAGHTDAFSLKKKERRGVFQGPAATTTTKEATVDDQNQAPQQQQQQQTYQTADNGATPFPPGAASAYAFALPPNYVVTVNNGQYAIVNPDDVDDDVQIGYGTAIASCLLSIALGFGLGYGT